MNWTNLVRVADDNFCRQLAAERQIPESYFTWLRGVSCLGCIDGQPAFPVHDPNFNVVGCHFRKPPVNGNRPEWGYRWFSANGEHPPVTPLVFGNPKTAKVVWIFESQWDGFALSAYLSQTDFAIIITRGAQNGGLVSGLLCPGQRVLVFPQNDPVKKAGNLTPAQKWLTTVTRNAGVPLFVVQTPPQHKDINDWTRAGATSQDLAQAIQNAVPAPPAAGIPDDSAPGFSRLAQGVLGDQDTEPESLPFPSDVFPSPYREMIQEAARAAKVPASAPGCLVLAALSTALTGGLAGKLIPPHTTHANTYLLGSMRSGGGKSTSFDPIFAPIYEIDRLKAEQWRRHELPALRQRRDAINEAIERLKKTGTKSEGVSKADAEAQLRDLYAQQQIVEEQLAAEPCLIAEDVTIEKLAVLLEQNRERMALISADAGAVVDNMLGRRNALKRPDDNMMVKAFSGDPVKVHRKTQPSVSLSKPLMNVLMLVQPDKVTSLMSERQLVEGGLMPRFLFAHIPTIPDYLDAEVAEIPSEVRSRYGKAIQELMFAFRLASETCVVEATAEAKMVLRAYYNQVVDQRRAALTDTDSFAARHAEQAARIAMALHAAKWGVNCRLQLVDLETARGAIQLAEWFAREQMNLLTEAKQAEMARILTGIENLDREQPEAFSVRDLQRKHIIESADEGRRILQGLVARNLAVRVPKATNGRPATLFKLVHQDPS